MSEKEPDVVTLSDSPMKVDDQGTPSATGSTVSTPSTPSSGTKGQKMKQMRLPFAPIQRDNAICRQKEEQEKDRLKAIKAKQEEDEKKAKAEEDKKAKTEGGKKIKAEDSKPASSAESSPIKEKKAENPRKRKHSETANGSLPVQRRKSLKESTDDGAVLKVKEANTPNDLIQDRTPIKVKMDFHRRTSSPLVESSPQSLEDAKRAVTVEIAKIKVKVMELKDKLDKAVEKQEFLQAQELKVEITKTEKDKTNLEGVLERADREEMKKVLTPSRKRISSSTCASPVLKKKPATTPKSEQKEKERKEKETAREKEKAEREAAKEKLKKEKEMEKEKVKKEKEMEKEKAKKEKEMEKEKAKKEKEMKMEQEKAEKERIRKEKEMEKERMKKEKEMKMEQEKAEKERIKKEKELEKERIKKEEQEKHDKLSKSFVSFFVKKPEANTSSMEQNLGNSDIFNQFRVKKDMKLAPVSRREIPDDFTNELFKDLDRSLLFLTEIKGRALMSTERTWPPKTKGEDDDIMVIDEDEEEDEIIGQQVETEEEKRDEKRKVKLLQFCENERPAYFGTWRKTSTRVGPRRPFAKDREFFDYEYDSDDDWEEEEQGESLSDEEKDKEEDDEEVANEDDDDGFFVGHGVLDKDEAHPEEDSDDDNKEVFDEDLEMTRMKMKAKQFEEEYKARKGVKKLKPRVFGCFWVGDDQINDQLTRILRPNRAILYSAKPIDTTFSIRKEERSPKVETTKAEFPAEAVKDLVRLVHQSPNNKKFLVEEFQLFLKGDKWVSKEVIKEKVVEIAKYSKCLEPGPMLNRMCWMVKPEILTKLGQDLDLSTPWVFDEKNPCKPKAPTPSRADKKQSDSVSTPAATPTPTPSPTAASLITKFTKVLTDDERQKQMAKRAEKPTPSSPAAAASPVQVKTPVVRAEAKLLAKHLIKKRITPTNIDKDSKKS